MPFCSSVMISHVPFAADTITGGRPLLLRAASILQRRTCVNVGRRVIKFDVVSWWHDTHVTVESAVDYHGFNCHWILAAYDLQIYRQISKQCYWINRGLRRFGCRDVFQKNLEGGLSIQTRFALFRFSCREMAKPGQDDTSIYSSSCFMPVQLHSALLV
jgi:hypothetical protein